MDPSVVPIAAFVLLGLVLGLRRRAQGPSATWTAAAGGQGLLLFFLATVACDASAALGLGVALAGAPYALAAGFLAAAASRQALDHRRRSAMHEAPLQPLSATRSSGE
jgi:hypothetical protein